MVPSPTTRTTAAGTASAAKEPAAKTSPGKAPAAKTAAEAPTKAASKATAKAATKTPVKAATKTPVKAATKAPAKSATTAAARNAAKGAVDEETGFTAAELTTIRAVLAQDIIDMQAEYENSLAELDQLQQAGTDGAGDDQADAGAKTFDREQELSIAANRFDLLSQMLHAVERIEHGTYGFCEICGRPIPRVRLEAFPMATMDVVCKQREERR